MAQENSSLEPQRARQNGSTPARQGERLRAFQSN